MVQDFIRIVLTRPDLRENNYLDHVKADWSGLPGFMKNSLFDGLRKYLEEDYSGALNCFNETVQKEPHNGYALVLRAFTNFRLKNRAAAEPIITMRLNTSGESRRKSFIGQNLL